MRRVALGVSLLAACRVASAVEVKGARPSGTASSTGRTWTVGSSGAARRTRTKRSQWFHADDRDVWNEVQITCRGTRITTVVNGVTIADYDGVGRLDDETHRSRNVGMKGHIGLQIHPGDELLIRFKDIEVSQR